MAVYTEVSLSEAQELFQPLGKIIEFEGIKAVSYTHLRAHET